MFRSLSLLPVWPRWSAGLLIIGALVCSGCALEGFGGGFGTGYGNSYGNGYGNGYGGGYQQTQYGGAYNAGYGGYPVYQRPPVQVFGGYYQSGQNVQREDNRGRQSLGAFRQGPQFRPGGYRGGQNFGNRQQGRH